MFSFFLSLSGHRRLDSHVKLALIFALLHAKASYYTDTTGSALSPLHTRFCDFSSDSWVYRRWMGKANINLPRDLRENEWFMLDTHIVGLIFKELSFDVNSRRT